MFSKGRKERQPQRFAAAAVRLAAVIAVGIAGSGLIAGAAAPAQQAGALVLDLGAIPAGAAKSPVDMDSRLVRLEEVARQEGPAAMRRFAADNGIPLDPAGRPRVLIGSMLARMQRNYTVPA